jgi:hypothetical protein
MALNYIVEQHDYAVEDENVYKPYGALKEFFMYRGPECIASGPYDTGKTLCMMQKLNWLMWHFENSHALLVRKSYSSLLTSALVTYYNKVLPYRPGDQRCPVDIYGGGVPQHITYPNGSRIILGGLDIPEKVLSSEYDFIAVPQAEELSLHDWEQLLGRCSGRAGNAPWHQLMGDCNPDVPGHWIVNRDSLKVFHTRHVDNPTLFKRDRDGDLVLDKAGNPVTTDGGKGRIKILQSMTGLRYKRGYLGLWVGAEGQVYEGFDPSVHIVDPHDLWDGGKPPDHWKMYRAIDFGYTHPFVCQWWVADEDERLYLYREMYMSKRTVRAHILGPEGTANGIVSYSGSEKYRATICDHDAEGRAELHEYGIPTIAADKRIQIGIEKVQDRLRVREDGRPRIFFCKNSLVEVDETLRDNYQPVRTTEEFAGYVWRKLEGRKEQTSKDEVPIRTADHGMDAMRYMVMHLDGGKIGQIRVMRYA